MEALVAVGLAANVLQFVQFGYELFSLSTEIRKSTDGRSVRHDDLDTIAKDIRTHCRALATQCSSPGLQKLANDALKVAEDLLDATEDIRRKSKKSGLYKISRWRSFRQALEAIWKNDKVTHLATRLESLRHQVEFHFITEIRASQNGFRDTLDKMCSDNATMDSQLLFKLEQTLASLDTIRSELSSRDSITTISNFRNAFDGFCDTFQDVAKPWLVLNSLRYTTMTVRHTAITEAHKRTFEWIFKTKDLPIEDHRSKVDLESWLRNGSGLYWINGKPGSGKSTLMKFLEGHETTWDLLREWSHPMRLVPASFYFWNAGTHMQKSLEGLLQSLLHMTLSHCPNLIPVVCGSRWSSAAGQISNPWLLPELQDAFAALKSQEEIPTKFYFHIDGLDEYDGDLFRVIKIIDDLAKLPSFKICVSSRPWNEFQHTIGNSNNGSLQLHLFTRRDIELFARESILNHRIETVEDDFYNGIIHEIGERSQGVFLWVRLVVHSLRDGIFNGDPISLLRKRLEELPSDLEDFFEHILRSVDPVYAERMAWTFLTAIASPEPLTMIRYSFLDEEDPYFGWTKTPEPLELTEISERIAATRWRLNGRYKGLLEPSSDMNLIHVTVDFLHRTLKDFLATSKMDKFLRSRAPQGFDPSKAAVGAVLAEVKTLPPLSHKHFAEVVRFAKDIGDKAMEFCVIDHIETVLPMIYPTLLHLSTQPDLLLRAAVHHQQDDYVKHRVESTYLPAAVRNWCLVHLTSLQRNKRSNESFIDILWKELELLTSCECEVATNGTNTRPNTDLIAILLGKNANPCAIFRQVSVWDHFLMAFESNVNNVNNDFNNTSGLYWTTLKLMVLRGAPINGNNSLWVNLATRMANLQLFGLSQFLEGFTFLLSNGLHAGSELYVNVLWGLDDIDLHSSMRKQVRKLISSFLVHGADVTQICRVTSTPIGQTSWLSHFLSDLEEGYVWFCGLEVHDLFQIFLQYGLDTNIIFQGVTLWQHIIRAVNNLEYTRCRVELILLFLQYRADPHLEELHQMLGWRTGFNCKIPEPQASELKAAVRREVEDLERRDETSFRNPKLASPPPYRQELSKGLPSNRSKRSLLDTQQMPSRKERRIGSDKRRRRWP